MKLVRIYAVIAIEDEAYTSDDAMADAVADLVEDVVGDPMFVAVRPGYAGEFEEMGADPEAWEDLEEPPPFFVSYPSPDSKENDLFLCRECLPKHPEVDPGSDAVMVWEEGSDGWLGPVACGDCGRDIPVVANGEPTPRQKSALN